MTAFARGARTGVRMIRRPSDRNTSSKEAVNFVSRSWIRKRVGEGRSARTPMMIAGLLGRPLPGPIGRDPGDVHDPALQLDEHEHV
jgi:hypothetical protein